MAKWRRIVPAPEVPPAPQYQLANLPHLPPNADDPPAAGPEAALDEPRRKALRVLKSFGLHGEIDAELMPYLLDAEQCARNDIAVIGAKYGSCNSVAGGLVAHASLARCAALAALARGDLKAFARCEIVYAGHIQKANAMAEALSGADERNPWDDPEDEVTPTAAPAAEPTEEPWDPNPPKPAITIESNDGTVEHPEPGADPAPSLLDLLEYEEGTT